MIKFAEYYLNNYQTIDSSELVSKIIARSIIATAIENTLEPSEILQEIAQDIATGKAKSLSKAKSKTAFIITKSISLIINQDLDNTERLELGAKEFLGDSENLKEFVTNILEKYSPIVGILGKEESIESLKHDMAIIIGHGSQRVEGQKNQAERYLELKKFEAEVKGKIISYIKSETTSTPEVQEYLADSAIKAAEYLRADYATGLDRGLKPDEIKKRLLRIEKIIDLIKKGEAPVVIGSKIIKQVKGIVDSHPSLSHKEPSSEDY